MARPALSEEDKKKVQVNIRLTEQEHKKVRLFAEGAGVSPANWIRHKVFTGRFPVMKISPLDAALYRELHKIGVNLNQLVKKVQGVSMQTADLSVLNELLLLEKEIIKRLLS